MTPESALSQAHSTAHDYALYAINNLRDILGIDRRVPDWPKHLEPWTPVIAAMITAASADFANANRYGVINTSEDQVAAAIRALADAVAEINREKGT